LPAFAQDYVDDNHNIQVDIPEVALVDMKSSSGTEIILNIDAPTEAGLRINADNAKDSSV